MALQNFDISFDVYGNLYFSHNQINNTYQLNIDGKNKITLDQGDYPIIEHYKKIYRIQHLDENSLKSKIRKEEDEHDDEHDYDEDEDADSDEINNSNKYYPEDDDHVPIDDIDEQEQELEYIDEDSINQYGENNHQFTFWTSELNYDSIKIYKRKDGDIMSLYDTYIYDVNNRLIFKSNSLDGSSIYRLRIFPTGELFFRPIGYTEEKYILNANNGELKIA
ncbi:MAG: hypothetical protein MUO21_07005 [Nitrososphaeraceae archaeon]|nr:hypothetical protein [Nitrososphaeraceae archaeon]